MHVLIGSTHIIFSSETCQYNSNVLTLVAVTCNVADFSEDCLIRITKSTTNICLWHFEDEGPHDYSYSAAM